MGRVIRIAGLVLCALLAVAVIGWLVVQLPDVPFETLRARYANAQSHWADMGGGVRLHYRDQGNPAGPPIVLVHGFAASLHAWEPWVAELGGTYRIVTLDLPGHGLTEAPAGYVASIDGNAELVDALAQRLQLGRYVVGGNSMGGGVAWDLAMRHPDHLRALVLVDAVGGARPTRGQGGRPPAIFAMMRGPVGRAILRNTDLTALAKRGLQQAYVDPRIVTPQLVARYVELSRAPGHRDILLAIDNRPARPPTPAAFADIKVPTLGLHGEADALIPVASGRALAAAIPGARLITYPGVGHVPMEQIPARSAADLRAFLERLKP